MSSISVFAKTFNKINLRKDSWIRALESGAIFSKDFENRSLQLSKSCNSTII